MAAYIVYLVSGAASAWLTLFMWGFSAGPANPAPYYRLIGSLMVWLCASVLTLYCPRPAAVLALACTAISIGTALWYGSFWALVFPPDLAVAACAAVVLVRPPAPRPGIRLRLVLSLVPLVACFFMINVRLVAPLILAGPPPEVTAAEEPDVAPGRGDM